MVYQATGTGGTASHGGGAGGDSTNKNGTDGTINTGGGGGGASSGASVGGGNGGKGIIILRYPDTYDPASSTTGSPTYTVSGGYRIYKFTDSGTILW